MAIKFVQVDPGAARPDETPRGGELPLDEPAGERPSGPAGSPEATPVPEGGEPALPAGRPKPGRRRKPAPDATPEAPDPAAAGAPPEQDIAPLLFPDLPLHPRPGAKARRNRRGFG